MNGKKGGGGGGSQGGLCQDEAIALTLPLAVPTALRCWLARSHMQWAQPSCIT